MFTFKTLYDEAIENWQSKYLGGKVGNLQFAQLFNEAYERAAVVKTATQWFKKDGHHAI